MRQVLSNWHRVSRCIWPMIGEVQQSLHFLVRCRWLSRVQGKCSSTCSQGTEGPWSWRKSASREATRLRHVELHRGNKTWTVAPLDEQPPRHSLRIHLLTRVHSKRASHKRLPCLQAQPFESQSFVDHSSWQTANRDHFQHLEFHRCPKRRLLASWLLSSSRDPWPTAGTVRTACRESYKCGPMRKSGKLFVGRHREGFPRCVSSKACPWPRWHLTWTFQHRRQGQSSSRIRSSFHATFSTLLCLHSWSCIWGMASNGHSREWIPFLLYRLHLQWLSQLAPTPIWFLSQPTRWIWWSE